MSKPLKTLLFLGSLGITSAACSLACSSAVAANPPATEPDYSSILDLQPSAEEHMVSGGDLPATPESGNENAEDLLKSAPSMKSSRGKSTATRDGMPGKLPVQEGSHLESALTGQDQTAELPPLPETTEETLAPSDQTAAESEAPAESSELPADHSRYSDSSGSSVKKWDRSVPLYDRENPNWAIDIHGSLGALGSPGLQNNTDPANVYDIPTRNFGIGFEWEPDALQSAGVFSIGPSMNLYYVDDSSVTKSAFSIYSAGVSAKYQFKYWRGQPFVPFVGFETQFIKYSIINGDSGIANSKGLTFGGMLLLNWMEPSAAHSLFSDHGIRRSYLVGEAKQMTADKAFLSVDGMAYYFGLRMEY